MFLGLPLHPLAVHFGIVLGLLSAGAVLLAAVLPRFRNWLSWGLPVAAVIGGLTLRVTAMLGQALALSSPTFETAAVEHHSAWGFRAGILGIALAVVGLLLWSVTSPWVRERWSGRWPGWLATATTVLAVVVAFATLVVVTLSGHTGATAVWG